MGHATIRPRFMLLPLPAPGCDPAQIRYICKAVFSKYPRRPAASAAALTINIHRRVLRFRPVLHRLQRHIPGSTGDIDITISKQGGGNMALSEVGCRQLVGQKESLSGVALRNAVPDRRFRKTAKIRMGRIFPLLFSCINLQASPFAASHFFTRPAAFAASLPVTARPLFTTAPGQVFLISRSLLPMPLPSLVQSGRIVFPEKSKFSRKVNRDPSSRS